MELSKVCTDCNVSKCLSNFWDKKGGKLGKNSKCKECFKNDDNIKRRRTEYNKARWQAFKSSPEFNQVTEQQRFYRKNRIHNLICSNNYVKAVQLARDYDMDVENVEIEIENRKQILKHFNL